MVTDETLDVLDAAGTLYGALKSARGGASTKAVVWYDQDKPLTTAHERSAGGGMPASLLWERLAITEVASSEEGARLITALTGRRVRLTGQRPTTPPTLAELRERALREGNEVPGRRTPSAGGAGSIIRIGSVRDAVRARARVEGCCEGCGDLARFEGDRGGAFFYVHHIHALGEGGPDTLDNCIALCGNCHAEVEYGARKAEFNADLRVKLDAILATAWWEAA